MGQFSSADPNNGNITLVQSSSSSQILKNIGELVSEYEDIQRPMFQTHMCQVAFFLQLCQSEGVSSGHGCGVGTSIFQSIPESNGLIYK